MNKLNRKSFQWNKFITFMKRKEKCLLILSRKSKTNSISKQTYKKNLSKKKICHLSLKVLEVYPNQIKSKMKKLISQDHTPNKYSRNHLNKSKHSKKSNNRSIKSNNRKFSK